MRKNACLTLVLLIATCFCLAAQEADTIKTKRGNLIIHPVLHGSLVLEWEGSTVYIDPYGGGDLYSALPDPDLILITDIHGDHQDQSTLSALNTEESVYMVPQAVADKFETKPKKYKVIANDESLIFGAMRITAIPMYNLTEEKKNFHTKGRGNGYLIEVDGKRIYVSGDTEDIPEMRALKDIDIAFVCMNLPYTMTVEQAADAVLEFAPKEVYPYHYRGKPNVSDVNKFETIINSKNKNITVVRLDWYPNDDF